VLELVAALSLAAAGPPMERIFFLHSRNEPTLSVHHEAGTGPAVLYVHGATFPAALSMNYRMAGSSWADDLHHRGFDVWSFDFAGYGASERPASMRLDQVARKNVPGRVPDAARQIERVIRYIRRETHGQRVSIIAHSWGTIPAGLAVSNHPAWIDKLILFGPVAKRDGKQAVAGTNAPTALISAQDQWESFQSGVPHDRPSPISKSNFEQWVKTYLATDARSGTRSPPSVEVPAGPQIDFAEAWNGKFPYNPRRVRAPTLIVRGEWDAITQDADAAWLVHNMANVPGGVRELKLPHGAHRMHLEANRQVLFDAVAGFLAEGPP